MSPCTFQSVTKFAAKVSLLLQIFRAGLGEPLRSIIDYIITRQNSGLKFQDVRVFRGLTVGSGHYLVNAKILFTYGRNIANELRENKTEGELELLQLPEYDIDSLRDGSTSFL